MTALQLDVWSDIACPWCWVGKRRLRTALERFGQPVSIRLRAFELDPTAPREKERGIPYAERLAQKYGTTVERGQAMVDTMTQAGAMDGLELRFDRIRPGNTFDAHRLIQLAARSERDAEMEERFFRAYLHEGEPIGEPETLARLAIEVGLDAEDVARVLEGEEFAEDVRADEGLAQQRGIHGVPCFVIADRFALSGAQPPDEIERTLRAAWELEQVEGNPDSAAEAPGASCGPEGCD